MAAHIGATLSNHTWAQHGQYSWHTCVGFMLVPCGYFERQNTWAPCGKLLHTPVCPISDSPRVAHERHTLGSIMGPMEFCYLGSLCCRRSEWRKFVTEPDMFFHWLHILQVVPVPAQDGFVRGLYDGWVRFLRAAKDLTWIPLNTDRVWNPDCLSRD